MTGAIKAVSVIPVDASKKLADISSPRHGGEFVHRGDHEARQASVDRFINGQNRQRLVACEGTATVGAGHPQVHRGIRVGLQLEGIGRKLGPTPRAIFERDRRGFAVVVLKGNRPGTGRIAIIVTPCTHDVGRGGLPHPEANLKRPGAELFHVLLPL